MGSFVLPKMGNRSEFHPSGRHLLHTIQNYRPSKTTESIILMCADRLEQPGAVQMIVPNDGEGCESAIRSLDNQPQ